MEVETSGKPIDSVLERVLCMNILSSDYFKELYRLKSYEEVVDEIYNQVDHAEPWMTGNCRGPSTAFCLLYKLFTMKLTVEQMQGLLNHGDSPYIRAVGFLYLRYVGDSKSLWSWFEQYVTDDEEFSPGSNARMTTMGLYVRDLLLDQYYFDTLFPRIPVPVMRQITSHLEHMKLSTQPSGVTGTGSRHASDDTARRPPSVKAALSVSFGQRAPHRASTRDFSPVRRSTPATREHPLSADDRRNSQEDTRRQSRDRDSERDKAIHRERERDRYRDSQRSRESDRPRVREREADRERYKDVDRKRSRDRDSNRERAGDRERESSRERGREKDWDDRDSSKRRSRARDRSGDRSPEKDRHWHSDGRRSRYDSPERSGGGSHRDTSSVNGNGASLTKLSKLRAVYGSSTDDGKGSDGSLTVTVKESTTEDVFRLGGSTWSQFGGKLCCAVN